jgi:hypothetical protein
VTIHEILDHIGDFKKDEDYMKRFVGRVYGTIINEGFWADIGKPPLREKALEYYKEKVFH